MLFSSITFLYYFLPLTLLVYFLTPDRGKNGVLLLASMIFYGWGEQRLVLMFAASVFAGWVWGLWIEKWRDHKSGKIWLMAAVLSYVGLLVYFKYTDFFLAILNAVAKTSFPLPGIVLPIGISFYTFQLLSYTVDVYRGTVPAQKNPVDFGAYVAMFPQLIAGPIVRYADIAKQLKERHHTVEGVAWGIRRFILGLGKKVLLANVLGELCSSFQARTQESVLFYWLYAVAFMLQIYFDFSGYSDMAIGLGRMFGFQFMENFRYPYWASSITEFWRRWHISLSSWFRDYVYIPLGGNRKGILRQMGNIFLVWMLTGLWHGAAWNFVLWGLFFALLLILEKVWLKAHLERHPVAGHLYVLFAVLLGFVLFDGASLRETADHVRGLFAFGQLPLISSEAVYALRSYGLVLLMAGIGATPFPHKLVTGITETEMGKTLQTVLEPLALCILLLTVTAYLVDGSFNPFLYFRF